jgi:hypothetical protein
MKTITAADIERKFGKTLTRILQAAERDRLSAPFVVNVSDDDGLPVLQARAEQGKRGIAVNSADWGNLVNLVGKKLDVLVHGVNTGRPRMMSKRPVDSNCLRYAVTKWMGPDPRYRQILINAIAQPQSTPLSASIMD